MTNLIQQHQHQIKQLSKTAGIKYLALFGSHSRDESNPDSDIDLLVEFNRPVDLIEVIQTKHQFEDLLKRKVDLITKKGLSQHLKPYIEKDLQVIYENP